MKKLMTKLLVVVAMTIATLPSHAQVIVNQTTLPPLKQMDAKTLAKIQNQEKGSVKSAIGVTNYSGSTGRSEPPPAFDSLGNAYGVSWYPGFNVRVWKAELSSGTSSALRDLDPNNEGYIPAASLVIKNDIIWGATASGGPGIYNPFPQPTWTPIADGSIFWMNTAGSNFGYAYSWYTNGTGPIGPLAFDGNDIICTMASGMGTYPYGRGGAIKISTNNTVIWKNALNPNESQGATPYSNLLKLADGTYRFMTPYGGANGKGTFCSLSADGLTKTVLTNFPNDSSGAFGGIDNISFLKKNGKIVFAINGTNANQMGAIAVINPNGTGLKIIKRYPGTKQVLTQGTFEMNNDRVGVSGLYGGSYATGIVDQVWVDASGNEQVTTLLDCNGTTTGSQPTGMRRNPVTGEYGSVFRRLGTNSSFTYFSLSIPESTYVTSIVKTCDGSSEQYRAEFPSVRGQKYQLRGGHIGGSLTNIGSQVTATSAMTYVPIPTPGMVFQVSVEVSGLGTAYENNINNGVTAIKPNLRDVRTTACYTPPSGGEPTDPPGGPGGRPNLIPAHWGTEEIRIARNLGIIP